MTIEGIHNGLLAPLEGVVRGLEGGEFDFRLDGGNTIGSEIRISQRDKVEVVFFHDGTAQLLIKAGAYGAKDTASTWTQVAYLLLLLIDFYGQQRLEAPNSTQKLTELRRFASTL
ncbi:MAG: hypothetical protein M1275_03715 [Patescibacteria group bacterium]|nr:hypothetical protein [Patescibacteria group bacterium]